MLECMSTSTGTLLITKMPFVNSLPPIHVILCAMGRLCDSGGWPHRSLGLHQV